MLGLESMLGPMAGFLLDEITIDFGGKFGVCMIGSAAVSWWPCLLCPGVNICYSDWLASRSTPPRENLSGESNLSGAWEKPVDGC